jgi:hypothetical protein
VISNDEVQIRRTIRKNTKSEVQFNSKKLISDTSKSSSMHRIPMLKFRNRIIYVPLTKFKKKYSYEPQTVQVRIYNLKSLLQPLFHNYLIDVEYFQNFLCMFVKEYCQLESKIQYDKLDKDVEAREGKIRLIHGSFGNTIKVNRPRMDSTDKEFEQQLLLGPEYGACVYKEIVKCPPDLEAEEQNFKDYES